MKKLDLKFLANLHNEQHVLSGFETQLLVSNVMSVLRANRGTGKLSDQEVMIGNTFILTMVNLFSQTDVYLDITADDLDNIIQENNYMRMGCNRNQEERWSS